jgi:hypothetical protein
VPKQRRHKAHDNRDRLAQNFQAHFRFAFFAGFSQGSFARIRNFASIIPRIASGRVTDGTEIGHGELLTISFGQTAASASIPWFWIASLRISQLFPIVAARQQE